MEMRNPQNLQIISNICADGDQRFSARPRSVVADPSMPVAEKRALLASWASDLRAVPNYPALRRLDDGQLVAVGDVLDALKQLDALESPGRTNDWDGVPWRGHWSRVARRWRRYLHDDDDDDDPSSPAPASVRPLRPIIDGAGVVAA